MFIICLYLAFYDKFYQDFPSFLSSSLSELNRYYLFILVCVLILYKQYSTPYYRIESLKTQNVSTVLFIKDPKIAFVFIVYIAPHFTNTLDGDWCQ